MKRISLKQALLKSILLPLAGYIVAIGGLAYYTTIKEIDSIYDANLITAANVLYAITAKEVAENDVRALQELDISDKQLTENEREVFNRQAEWRAFRIWHNGRIVTQSDVDDWAGLAPFSDGFTNIKYQGNAWRIYTLLVPEEHISVELGEQRAARHYLVASIVESLIWPFLLSLPLAVWLFSRALDFGLNGLRKVTRQVNTRSPELMSPLPVTHIPADLVPLVEAINGLLDKLSDSLQREQQLADNAAHELRTPLAALKLQAQLAQRAGKEKDRDEALGTLLEGVDRASHVVDQLLSLARIKNQNYVLEPVDAMQSARQIVATLKPLLDQRHIYVTFAGNGTVMAKASEQLLNVLLTNIIDNAVKYSPDGGMLRIEGRLENGSPVLTITDEGPGIPEAEREKVFARFYRANQNRTSGSGLGLAVARECVGRMWGGITLNTPDNSKGLTVRITLLPA